MDAGNKSIGLVTLWTPQIKSWSGKASQDKQDYCKKWNIAYYPYEDRLDESREPTWSKIIAIQKNLQSHDWIVWMDADAAITNFLTDVRDLCDDRYDLIVSHDHAGFNAGVFLIKNTPAAREFLNRVWEKNVSVFHFEQTAMNDVMDEMEELRVKIVPKRKINSYWFDHRPGDFIFHAAGEPNEIKGKLLTVFSNAKTV